MSGGTVALMSGGTYDSGTKVAASTVLLVLQKNSDIWKMSRYSTYM
jgi:hypothetical protein